MRLGLPLIAAALLSPGGVFAPPVWRDARDVPGDRLDIRAVSFGQRDTPLWLKVRTTAAPAAGERVCLVLAAGPALCRPGAIAGALARRAGGSLSVRFHPRAAGLALGRVRWAVETRRAGQVVDRAPDRGFRSAEVGPLGEPRCFGAAARAGRRPCRNPALGRTVTPSPTDAYWMRDSPCHALPAQGVLRPCAFGDRDSPRAPAAALIGDSHSRHLRSAVEVVAQARGWRAVAMTHAGCAFSTEVYDAPGGIPALCHAHGEQALRWLREHPSVHTVFTSASTGRGFGPGGFTAMWSRVPRSVRRIYVIRDVPRVRRSSADCVRAVIRRRARPWSACAVPRAAAVLPDPAAAAAAAAGGRVRLVDLDRYFCDRARCFPVIGGVYAYRDDNHINRVFATTLGPYLLRAVDAPRASAAHHADLRLGVQRAAEAPLAHP